MGRVARRLEDDGVAADQGRHHLPARDRHREVPGRDDPGHPDRLADRHRPLVGQLGRGRVAEQAAALAGHQEGDVDALLDIAAGLGQDLAHLAGHRPGEALLVLGHQRAEAVQDLAPLRAGVRRQRRPAVSAERIAFATSAAVPDWKWPITSRVSAGLRLSNVRPPPESTHSPAMNSWNLGTDPVAHATYPLERHRHRAAAAQAQGREAVATGPPLQLVEQRRDDPGAACPDRVAERDRSPVHVDLRPVEAELAAVGQRLGGERLVDLDQVECLDRHLDPLEQPADAGDRARKSHFGATSAWL